MLFPLVEMQPPICIEDLVFMLKLIQIALFLMETISILIKRHGLLQKWRMAFLLVFNHFSHVAFKIELSFNH